MKPGERLVELDALRGLAAFTVVLHHFLFLQPLFAEHDPAAADGLVRLWLYTPLHLLFAGHEAVVFFFILSGFVLALPYVQGKRPSYGLFLIKRLCRIYLPYLAAVGTGLVCMLTLHGGRTVHTFSNWYNEAWHTPVSWTAIGSHLLMLGSFDSHQINPVIWSLVIEMRVSLLFPLLMLVVMKRGWPLNLGFALGLSLAGIMLYGISNVMLRYASDYHLTLHYAAMFVLGAVLAKHRNSLTARLRAYGLGAKLLLLVLGVLAYTYAWWLLPAQGVLHLMWVNDWIISGGVALLVMLALSSGRIAGVLRWRPIQFLGQISYSLYLYHCLVLFALVTLLYAEGRLLLVYATALPLALVVSTAMHYGVEVPAMKLGNRIAANWKRRPVPRSGSAAMTSERR